MAKPELGTKRACQNCSTKFFDLNKDPIVCPKCSAVFQAAALPRAVAAAAAAVKDDDVEADPMAAVLVPLEEADGDKAATPAGDDVAGLIDGDIESDEEA